MRKRYLLLVPTFFILLVVGTYVGIYVHSIFMDAQDWRSNGQRYSCLYDARVTGLSGREVQGTTVIMVPISASKEGKFFTPPAQKDPIFAQNFMHEAENWPEQHCRGPYFSNMTEIFDKQQEIIGGWMPFIAETEKGYMLGFRTNETRLEDFDYSASLVADYFDIFDPINNGSPILFPIENVTNISSVPYGDYTKYSSFPTYDSYVYLSDNLKGREKVSFYCLMQAHNDATKWSSEYSGEYMNEVVANANDTGYVKVRAILGQVIPHGPDADYSAWENRYGPNYYDNETDGNEVTYIENLTPIDDLSYNREL